MRLSFNFIEYVLLSRGKATEVVGEISLATKLSRVPKIIEDFANIMILILLGISTSMRNLLCKSLIYGCLGLKFYVDIVMATVVSSPAKGFGWDFL